MNTSACSGLTSSTESGTWYRALAPAYLPTALHTVHTPASRSRYSPGHLLNPSDQFEILYLAADPVTALFEYEAVYGDPSSPIPNPAKAAVILNVDVNLQRVFDLTDVAGAQTPLGTTAQELTGDWRGYETRALPGKPVRAPTGQAPTQVLGLHIVRTGIEGFRTLSAKLPTNKNLVVFPKNLLPGSRLTYRDSNTGLIVHQIP